MSESRAEGTKLLDSVGGFVSPRIAPFVDRIEMTFSQFTRVNHWRAVAARPDFWLGAVCTMVVVWSASQLLLFSFGRDQSIYALVGRGILEGDMPYRDRWDFKPPGIFLVYALAEAVFGAVMWGPRVFEALGLVLSGLLLLRLSHVFFADGRPGFIAAAIASFVHVQFEFWHTGQPESFAGFLTIAALAAATYDPKRDAEPSARTWFLFRMWALCGACFGLAFLLKPPLGGGAIVCAAYLARQELSCFDAFADPQQVTTRRRLWVFARPFLIVGGASVLPIALVGGWFGVNGAWGELSWTLFEFTPAYTKLGWGTNAASGFYRAIEGAFTKYSALVGVGSVAAMFGAPISSRDREGLSLVLGVLALQLAGIAMQAKFFEYHFGASLPLVALVAGLGWFKIWRLATRQGGAGAVAFASLVVVVAMARRPVYDVPEGFWVRAWERTKVLVGLSEVADRATLDERFHFVADFNLFADRQVAQRVVALTSPTDPIFVWGFEPAVYWFAERPLASRYVYNVPQRVAWERDRARHQLLADLQRSKPAVVVVQSDDTFPFVTGSNLDSRSALEEFPELRDWMNSGYAWIERVQDFDLYRRK